MNKRDLKLDEYGISSKRFKELCGFCEQYPEWKNYLKYNRNNLKSPEITGMPTAPYSNGDRTGDTAIKCYDFSRKCDLIERVAKMADEELWESLIKAVCYEVPVVYLTTFEAPISKSAFYERRRYFFYLLDKEKKD